MKSNIEIALEALDRACEAIRLRNDTCGNPYAARPSYEAIKDARAAITATAAEIATLSARCETMAMALKPFAAVADEYSDQEDDSFEVWIDAGPEKIINASFRLRMYRTARAALASQKCGAPANVGWFCETCNARVPGTHVTFEETHDPKSGGCGSPVVPYEGQSDQYLIWSHEHGAWWGPDNCGYTHVLSRAGRYSKEDAFDTCANARDGWSAHSVPSEIPVREADALACEARDRRLNQRSVQP